MCAAKCAVDLGNDVIRFMMASLTAVVSYDIPLGMQLPKLQPCGHESSIL